MLSSHVSEFSWCQVMAAMFEVVSRKTVSRHEKHPVSCVGRSNTVSLHLPD